MPKFLRFSFRVMSKIFNSRKFTFYFDFCSITGNFCFRGTNSAGTNWRGHRPVRGGYYGLRWIHYYQQQQQQQQQQQRLSQVNNPDHVVFQDTGYHTLINQPQWNLPKVTEILRNAMTITEKPTCTTITTQGSPIAIGQHPQPWPRGWLIAKITNFLTAKKVFYNFGFQSFLFLNFIAHMNMKVIPFVHAWPWSNFHIYFLRSHSPFFRIKI